MDGGADLVVTSPPYADARTYGMDVSFTDEDYQELARSVWDALVPGGQALINLDAPVRDWTGDGRGSERGMHPWRFMLYAHDEVGFRVPDRLAFGRIGAPGAYTGRFRNDWEPLIWLQKPGGNGHFDKWPLTTTSVYQDGANCASVRRSDGSLLVRKPSGRAVGEGVTHRGTLWDYGKTGHGHTGAKDVEAADHPARMPYRFARDVVACFSAPGALVVDPFVGAGTTLVAALELGRRFVGGDLGVRATDGVPWVSIAHGIVQARAGTPVQLQEEEQVEDFGW
jgi:site-specific DNA-methyltransferase (adenine-specific)